MNPLDFINEKNAFHKKFTEVTGIPMPAGLTLQVAMPTYEVADNVVTLSCATEDATIMVSVNGGDFEEYSAPYELTETTAFTAYAVKDGLDDSVKVNFTATYVAQVATPTASCEGNKVTMACATEGAVISFKFIDSQYHTYREPIAITEDTTFEFFATKEGMLDSETATFTATYVEPNEEEK